MEMTVKKEGKVNIIAVEGRLDTTNYKTLDEMVNGLIEGGEKYLLFDLEKMAYISSSGLRVFLSALKKLKSENGQVVLSNIQPKIKEVFEISGFSTLFEITETTDEGLRSIS